MAAFFLKIFYDEIIITKQSAIPNRSILQNYQ